MGDKNNQIGALIKKGQEEKKEHISMLCISIEHISIISLPETLDSVERCSQAWNKAWLIVLFDEKLDT